MTVPADILRAVETASTVGVLTGAGMSAESGLATFRQPHTGLWSRFRPEELATPEAWQADPDLVWAWYQWRAGLVRAAEPNAGHLALARWAEQSAVSIVTQNVDDLHERAGSAAVQHLHGSLFAPRCADCGTPAAAADPPAPDDPVERLEPPRCSACSGLVRPGVVWFGEAVPGIDAAVETLTGADLLLVVGTSGVVHPAAGLADVAVARGVTVVEVNPDVRDRPGVLAWKATAATALPALVDAAAGTPR